MRSSLFVCLAALFLWSSPVAAQPANNACASAQVIPAAGDYAFDNGLATQDGTAVDTVCDASFDWSPNGGPHADIWFSYIAPAGVGQVQFDVCGLTTLDTQIVVYDDNAVCPPPATDIVACDDDSCGTTLQSSAVASVTAGNAYLIRVGSWSTTTTGSGTLRVTNLAGAPTNVACTATGDNYTLGFDYPAGAMAGDTVDINSTEPGAVNPIATLTFPTNTFAGTLLLANQGLPTQAIFDFNYTGGSGTSTASCSIAFNPAPGEDCLSAIALASAPQSVPFDNTTFSSDGAGLACTVINDIFYTITATAPNNLMTVDTCNNTFDEQFAVYSGTCGALTEIVCQDACGPVSFAVTAGEVYTIRVGAWGNGTGTNSAPGIGTMEITESMVVFPGNDDCANATPLGGGNVTALWDNSLATTDGPNTGCTIFEDIWFVYTPSGLTTEITIDTETTVGLDTEIAVYDGTACPPGADIDCDDDGGTGLLSSITIPVTAGNDYLIRVGRFASGQGGMGTLNITPNQDGVTNFACVPTGDNYALSWDNPLTGSAGDTIEISSDEPGVTNPIFSLTNPATSQSGSLLIANSGATIGVTFTIAYTGNVGTATTDCTAVFNAPPGDDCNNPQVVTTGSITPVDLTLAFPGGAPSPPCNQQTDINEDWYLTWTADVDSVRVTYDSPGNGDPIMVIYESCADVAAGTPVACDDPFSSTPIIELAPTLGVTYVIVVANDDGTPAPGTVTLEAIQAPVSNFACVAAVAADTADLSWDNPASGAAGDMIEISSDEPGVTNPVATIAWPANTASIVLLAANQGVAINVTFTATYVGAVGTATGVDCDVNLNPPANDDCINAIDLGTGNASVMWSNIGATTDGLDANPVCDPISASWATGDVESDLWYLYTPSATGPINVAMCAAGLDNKMVVYEDNGTCPPLDSQIIACDDDSCTTGLQAELTMNMTLGTNYLVRVGSFSAVTQGDSILEIGPVCADLTNFTATFDCNAQVVTLAWDENEAYTSLSLTADGTPTATQPTPVGAGSTNGQMDSPATGMIITYELTANCANGGVSVVTATVNTTVPSGADNLIIQLETADDVDSGAALEAALLAASETVDRITSDTDPCLAAYFTSAQNIWVLLGTFPEEAELTTALGDMLAAAAQVDGKNIYIEGPDHWAFDDPSNFDAIDGIDSGAVIDGDDSLTSLLGVNATGAMLDVAAAFPLPVVYNQANLGGDDWTDQFTLAAPGTGDADITVSNVIWRNAPDPGETDYIVGTVAVTTSGACVICSSFEFGGFGGDQNLLATTYLSHFGGGTGGVGDFQRGDCNNDGAKNIADPVRLLNFLFPQMPNTLACEKACDANDDGSNNIADAVAMLNVLFPTGPAIPWLAPDLCGPDPTADMQTCTGYTNCP